MCAENGSNYSASADTFPSSETPTVSATATGSPQVSCFTVMNGNGFLAQKCRFHWASAEAAVKGLGG